MNTLLSRSISCLLAAVAALALWPTQAHAIG